LVRDERKKVYSASYHQMDPITINYLYIFLNFIIMSLSFQIQEIEMVPNRDDLNSLKSAYI